MVQGSCALELFLITLLAICDRAFEVTANGFSGFQNLNGFQVQLSLRPPSPSTFPSQNQGSFNGYVYPVPQRKFRYPDDFEDRHHREQLRRERERERYHRLQRERELEERRRGRYRGRDRRPSSRFEEGIRHRHHTRITDYYDDDYDDHHHHHQRNRQQGQRKEKKTKERKKEKKEERQMENRRENRKEFEKEKRKLKEKENDLEEREERLRRRLEALEDQKRREKEREKFVDKLINEYRNMTLTDLQNFSENLRKNQMLEDEARKNGTAGGRRFKITEEREEIIRRPGQAPIVNRQRQERVQEGELGPGGQQLLEEEISRKTFNRNPNNGGGTGGRSFESSFERSRSSSSSSSSSSGSSRGPSGSSSSSSFEASSASSTRDSRAADSFGAESVSNAVFFSHLVNHQRASPIANDPTYLTVASVDEVLDKTGAASAVTRFCPVGSVYSKSQKRCFKWG